MNRLINRMRDRGDEGFTLIELMVVVLIIAILIAIAIPTFLGARKRAQRKQSQSAARNALTAEKTVYTDTQAYTANGAAGAALELAEPGLAYNGGAGAVAASSDPNDVSVAVSVDFQTVGLGVWSKSKDCYFMIDDVTTGTTYYKVEDGAQATCTAATAAGAGWTAGAW